MGRPCSQYARNIIEHALAHQLEDKAKAEYQHGTLWGKHVALMDDWTGYCTRGIQSVYQYSIIYLQHNYHA